MKEEFNKLEWTEEPLIHGLVIDGLPDDHPLSMNGVYCDCCRQMLHSEPPNEAMRMWVETEHGNFCLNCYGIRIEIIKEK